MHDYYDIYLFTLYDNTIKLHVYYYDTLISLNRSSRQ